MRSRAGLGASFAALLLVGEPAIPSARDLHEPVFSGKWTRTAPPINLRHIEDGEINHRGDAVGYHHRPNGLDPPGARLLRIVQPADGSGVYRAIVALQDPDTGAWVRKKAPSTFFPDMMSAGDVVEAILEAFHRGERGATGQFIGPSGRGFAIEGWFQHGRINAAYPLQGP
jgi:hypothetical protein